MEKAKYFSDDDWSIGRALERAEKVLEEYERGAQCSDINSALELTPCLNEYNLMTLDSVMSLITFAMNNFSSVFPFHAVI